MVLKLWPKYVDIVSLARVATAPVSLFVDGPQVLSASKNIQFLNLRHNKIGNEGLVALSTAMTSGNHPLQELLLDDNEVSAAGAAAYATAVLKVPKRSFGGTVLR